ncbi:MAG: hypothetical protein ACRDD3_03770 [Azovibrio sp.]
MLNAELVFLIVSFVGVPLDFATIAVSVGEIARAVFLAFMVVFLVSGIVRLTGYTSLEEFVP